MEEENFRMSDGSGHSGGDYHFLDNNMGDHQRSSAMCPISVR